MGSASMTVAIPEKLKKEMREIRGINWSEETRRFWEERLNRLKALQKLDELTKNSKLTEKDVEELGAKIKAGVARRHEERLKQKGYF